MVYLIFFQKKCPNPNVRCSDSDSCEWDLVEILAGLLIRFKHTV